MKKNIQYLFTLVAILCIAQSARAIGWPAGYGGVMLQGFYWDSYQTETKWNKLEARANELSPSFDLIWIPNSGRSSGGLGYHPINWFTNHSSDMGTESQLRSMIATYKAKDVGMIADVVINHRAGQSNWTDFPTEVWNGREWHIGPEGICRDDEVAGQAGQAQPTGAYDTGEKYGSARDLDHTNANVQDNCKNYMKCLLEKYGYVGFRLDMVKGYDGKYLGIYNKYAGPAFSVGEYWDRSYDAVAAWIERTGRESAAFDFPFKYAVNDAFHSHDLTKLVWMANGTPQPAGMIHYGYPQYAVTFIDNHDTYRQNDGKFNGNWAAANAFMICSPGTPCVFLPHWNACGDQIARMIAARKSVGVTNTSRVKVLKTTSNCYMAEVYGTKGKLVVKIGSATDSPAGYTSSQIFCSGEDYCIWTTNTGGEPQAGEYTTPETLYLLGTLDKTNGQWNTNNGIQMTRQYESFTAKDVTLVPAPGDTKAYFTLVTKQGSSWTVVNTADRFGAATNNATIVADNSVDIIKYAAGANASSAKNWSVAPGTYDVTANFRNMKLTITVPTDGYPQNLYLIGNVNGQSWSTTQALQHDSRQDGVFIYSNVTVDDAGDGNGYMSFITRRGADWDKDVNISDRYGAIMNNAQLKTAAPIKLFCAGDEAKAAYSWKVAAGKYDVKADLSRMTVSLHPAGTLGVDDAMVDDPDAQPIYYNLQGVRINNPQHGLYIKVTGNKTQKILLP